MSTEESSSPKAWRRLTKPVTLIAVIWIVSALVGSLGAFLPVTVLGSLQWYDNEVLRALIHPAAWLTIGVGTSALIAFFALADRTGTLRAPIAGSTTIVFLGLLLFPIWFSEGVDQVLVEKLVWAWTVIVVSYFGSEAAIQGTSIVQQRKAAASDVSTDLVEGLGNVPGDAGQPKTL